MQFLKLFLLNQQGDIRLLSYRACSMQATEDNSFESYVANNIDAFVASCVKFVKKLPSESCVVEIFGEVKKKHKIDKPTINIKLVKDLSEEQKQVMGFPPLVKRQLLQEIGIKAEDCCQNWSPLDNRQSDWIKEQQMYGFDERTAWALDEEIKRLIYERLVYFRRHAPKPADIVIMFKKQTYEFYPYLDDIIEGLRLDIVLDQLSSQRKLQSTKEKIENALPKLINCLGCLWW